MIQSYEEELSKFVQQVNEGKFIDPTGNPLLLLEELKQILEEAYSVKSRLLGLSKWKEAISGKPHDLSRVFRYAMCSINFAPKCFFFSRLVGSISLSVMHGGEILAIKNVLFTPVGLWTRLSLDRRYGSIVRCLMDMREIG